MPEKIDVSFLVEWISSNFECRHRPALQEESLAPLTFEIPDLEEEGQDAISTQDLEEVFNSSIRSPYSESETDSVIVDKVMNNNLSVNKSLNSSIEEGELDDHSDTESIIEIKVLESNNNTCKEDAEDLLPGVELISDISFASESEDVSGIKKSNNNTCKEDAEDLLPGVELISDISFASELEDVSDIKKEGKDDIRMAILEAEDSSKILSEELILEENTRCSIKSDEGNESSLERFKLKPEVAISSQTPAARKEIPSQDESEKADNQETLVENQDEDLITSVSNKDTSIPSEQALESSVELEKLISKVITNLITKVIDTNYQTLDEVSPNEKQSTAQEETDSTFEPHTKTLQSTEIQENDAPMTNIEKRHSEDNRAIDLEPSEAQNNNATMTSIEITNSEENGAIETFNCHLESNSETMQKLDAFLNVFENADVEENDIFTQGRSPNELSGENRDYDDEEITDIQDHRWEKDRNLQNDYERRHRAIEAFGNYFPADPNRNLSFHGYRRQLMATSRGIRIFPAKIDKPEYLLEDGRLTKPQSSSSDVDCWTKKKRKASFEHPYCPPAKRQKMSFEDHIELMKRAKEQYKKSSEYDLNYRYHIFHYEKSIGEIENFFKFYDSSEPFTIQKKTASHALSLEFVFKNMSSFYGANEEILCKECSAFGNAEEHVYHSY